MFNLAFTDCRDCLPAGTPSLTSNGAQLIDNLYQDRKETLLSVDDLVKEVVSTLEVGVIPYCSVVVNSF